MNRKWVLDRVNLEILPNHGQTFLWILVCEFGSTWKKYWPGTDCFLLTGMPATVIELKVWWLFAWFLFSFWSDIVYFHPQKWNCVKWNESAVSNGNVGVGVRWDCCYSWWHGIFRGVAPGDSITEHTEVWHGKSIILCLICYLHVSFGFFFSIPCSCNWLLNLAGRPFVFSAEGSLLVKCL